MKIIKLGDLNKLKSSFEKSADFEKRKINNLIENIVKPQLIEFYFEEFEGKQKNNSPKKKAVRPVQAFC